jgi:GT2 family glycosyltransferase
MIRGRSAEALLEVAKRRVLRLGLYRPRQHRPRELAIPDSYHREELPGDPPSFAIVTPSYNHAPFIRATIDSVLAQGYPRLRYLVMDGGSSDGTPAILSGHGGKFDWLSEADDGQAHAINKGFARVSGEIMGWLNSDDLLLPGTLAYVARYFMKYPEVDLVYGHRVFINSAGRETGRCVLPSHDQDALAYFDYVPQETLFWRHRVWTTVGPLDSSLQCTMDWDFVLRSAAAGFTFRRLPRFLGCFRVHPEQKTSGLSTRGKAEANQLRCRHFKRPVSTAEVSRGSRSYRFRQLACQLAYRMRLPLSR